jgi:hypothetical protein
MIGKMKKIVPVIIIVSVLTSLGMEKRVSDIPLTAKYGAGVTTTGSFISPAQQKKIMDLLVKNPAGFLSDIDLTIEESLVQKKKKLEQQLLQALSKEVKQKSAEKLAHVEQLLENSIGFIHENYADADILYKLLVANPFLVKRISDRALNVPQKAQAQEEAPYYSQQELATAFNILAQNHLAIALTYDEYRTLKDSYKNNPLFTVLHNIRECIGCAISRIKTPFVREYLENKVIEHIMKVHPNKSEKIIITDFASGQLFEIFVIVNKLVAKGYNNIRLNVIDTEYKNLLASYKYLQATNTGKLPIQFDHFFELSPDNINFIFDPLTGFDQIKTAALLAGRLEYAAQNNMFVTFSQWFNNLGISFDLVIYDNAQAYLDDSRDNFNLKADLLIAVDYYATLNHILEDLRKKTLKQTGMAFSLDHAYPTGVSVYLQNPQFYFSQGSQQVREMKHFKWNLEKKELEPSPAVLPETVDYAISVANLVNLFTE